MSPYGKFFLRGEDVDMEFMGTREKVVEVAQELANKHNAYIEVWPDPQNEDYKPLAVCTAVPKERNGRRRPKPAE